MDIGAIRTEYRLHELDGHTAGSDPISFFDRWLHEARQAGVHEVNAMTLATTSADGRPHARIVLLKGLEDGGFVFFTNFQSDKGAQLEAVPHAALVFFWPELERQVRAEGIVSRISEAASDAYFQSRPRDSQVGAHASAQSTPVSSRAALEAAEAAVAARYAGAPVPRPAHWGGYCLQPARVEFWQGRPGRLHDRILYEAAPGGWQRSRLAP